MKHHDMKTSGQYLITELQHETQHEMQDGIVSIEPS